MNLNQQTRSFSVKAFAFMNISALDKKLKRAVGFIIKTQLGVNFASFDNFILRGAIITKLTSESKSTKEARCMRVRKKGSQKKPNPLLLCV